MLSGLAERADHVHSSSQKRSGNCRKTLLNTPIPSRSIGPATSSGSGGSN